MNINSDSSFSSNIQRKYFVVLMGWSVLVAGSLVWNIRQEAQETMGMAIATARTNISKDISFRKWVASHGGVYVSPSERTPPNPYLKVPDRDVITTGGKHLTLMNPAYALRELQSGFVDDSGIRSHITSLKLLNPANIADDWETGVLKKFEQGSTEVMEVSKVGGQSHLRLMKPFIVESDCLKCHKQQGYKLGDIRGGISADVPLSIYQAEERNRNTMQILSHGLIWLIGFVGLGTAYRRERLYDDERKQMEDKVRQLAFHDTLTRLPNRRLLIDRLTQNMASSKRNGCYSALLFIDLDNFKPLNDTHGHVAGDLLLIEVAERLKGCVREMDTVARFGGDEFVIILSELGKDKNDSTTQARIVAEKILVTLSLPYQLLIKQKDKAETAVEHHCTASIGVVVFINHDGALDEILKRADTAMYQAKEAGRNLIRFYDLDT
ncbi:MAG: diguanylate cyclase [Gallionella sp.]|jgi:diguanylate cyclase (GGDEF)-like protein